MSVAASTHSPPRQAIELSAKLLEAVAEIDRWIDYDRSTEDDDVPKNCR